MRNQDNIILSDNALAVLERRYLIKDKAGRPIETPREMFLRVAGFIAQADRNYGADDGAVEQVAAGFFDMMAALEFMPNSPTLMNAGRELGQLSACFVLPVGDSMEEIFETNKNAALIHKSGGGTGFSFSRLRPRNSVVASTSGVASGPVSFMRVYDASTDAVKQGGTRRGANMGILRVDHPDILEFISCKEDTSQIKNFNISVAITDAFMEALAQSERYPLVNPETGRTHVVKGEEQGLNSSEVFDSIVEHAWKTGEPGVIFIDRMNRLNPTYPSEQIEATNPCGEQPLPAYDSCNLGSINVGRFAREPLPDNYTISQPESGIDWEKLAATVHRAVHFLDNVIDQNRYPIPEIEAQTQRNRRIGLGVMGWADLLVKLKLPYNSDQALELADKLMAFVQAEARNQSSELAKSRGRFPSWEKSAYAAEEEFQGGLTMRNATVTTIAPTGTISIIAGCSSGIEPYYSLAFERNVLDGSRLIEINPIFETLARESGFYTEELIGQLMSNRSIQDLKGIPDEVKSIFVTAVDVATEDHIRMQAAFQRHCDSSVSKTINLPEAATPEDVRRAYLLAYETGCKGVTVYRDDSRPDQVLSTRKMDTEESPSRPVAKRPTRLSGITEKIQTGYGNLYVTVNLKDQRPFEVFAHIGKSGYTTMADTEAICRLISLNLRSGVSVHQVIRQLRGIGGSSPVFSGGIKVSSIPDAIAQVLERHAGPGGDQDQTSVRPGEICPACSSAMTFESGCYCCHSCGYSSC